MRKIQAILMSLLIATMAAAPVMAENVLGSVTVLPTCDPITTGLDLSTTTLNFGEIRIGSVSGQIGVEITPTVSTPTTGCLGAPDAVDVEITATNWLGTLISEEVLDNPDTETVNEYEPAVYNAEMDYSRTKLGGDITEFSSPTALTVAGAPHTVTFKVVPLVGDAADSYTQTITITAIS